VLGDLGKQRALVRAIRHQAPDVLVDMAELRLLLRYRGLKAGAPRRRHVLGYLGQQRAMIGPIRAYSLQQSIKLAELSSLAGNRGFGVRKAQHHSPDRRHLHQRSNHATHL